MVDSSGETQFTFNENMEAPAEQASQSSPGTAESGSKSTQSGWHVMRKQRSRASTPRSSRGDARSGSQRSSRRTTTRPRTPKPIKDNPERSKGSGQSKRKSSETSGSREPTPSIIDLEMKCQNLYDAMTKAESYAASRDQLIIDIELKFTNYLQEYHQNVSNEINALNSRLLSSTTEIDEYQAELMVAAREDEGATYRIEELERRGAILESGAKRIYDRGMEIQHEYQDEVHHLRNLLSNAENRMQCAQSDSEYATSVAQRLFSEGREMQDNFEKSIVEYRNQSEMVAQSQTSLEIAKRQRNDDVRTLLSELGLMKESIEVANRKSELYENSMEQITRESRRKVHEANQAKAESDLRLRNAEHEANRRFESDRHQESEAIAKLRLESRMSSGTNIRLEHYEKLYADEKMLTDELRSELQHKDALLRQSFSGDIMATGHRHTEEMIGHLESQVKIAQIRAQDLVSEIGDYNEQSIQLKDKLEKSLNLGPSSFMNNEYESMKRELEIERKRKLANEASHYDMACEYLGEIQDRDSELRMKQAEINTKDEKLGIAEMEIHNLRRLIPGSIGDYSGILGSGKAPYDTSLSGRRIEELEAELKKANDENEVLRAWNRQLDEAYNEEMNAAQAAGDPRAGGKADSVMGGSQRGAGQRPEGRTFDFDPFANDEPPGLTPPRSQIGDDAASLTASAVTAMEPRVSRREADKVQVSPWP